MLASISMWTPLRSLIRKPGFALAVIVILALGIGANTATLSLLYRYFYARMPYSIPHQLVAVQFLIPKEGTSNAVSVPAFGGLRTQAPALESAALFRNGQGLNLQLGQKTLRIEGIACTASLFATLGVSPLLGQVFSNTSENPDAAPEIVLSYSMWRELLNRDPHIIGRTLHLNGRLYTVIGVMPQGFWFPSRTALFWIPLTLTPQDYDLNHLGFVDYNMIGRLTPGASVHQLSVQANAVLQQLTARVPSSEDRAYFRHNPWQISALSWRTGLVGQYHQSLILMQLATALLILLAWFNLANLFITRALTRRGELVLRRVLGVSTHRLFTDLLLESLTLCLVGTAAGLLLGRLLVALLQHSGLLSGSSIVPVQGWWISIAAACALGVVSSLVFATASFYCVRHEDLSQALREGDARASYGMSERRVRTGLVVVQVALACGLSGMGLMLARSMHNLNSVDLGFKAQQALTFAVDLPSNEYPSKHLVSALSELRDKLSGIPGVSSATVTSHVPFDHSVDDYDVFPSPWNQHTYTDAFTTIVDGAYFRTLGVPLLAGRTFTDLDNPQGEGMAVIDTLAAQQLFGTTQVLGREFSFHGANNTHPGSLFKVIGVVDNIHYSSVAQRPDIGSVYVDRNQVLGFDNTWWSQNQWMVAVRTPLPISRVLPLIRNAEEAILPGIPIYDIRTLKQRVDSHMAYRQGLAVLVAFFSLSALLLAAVGLYAVQNYTVRQRTREFGTRAALGADRSRLLRLVITEAGRLLVIGLILGLAGMVIIGRIFASALYGVSPLDPLTALIVLGVLAVTLFLAAWLPAWRASRVAPAVALRHE